MRLFFVLTLLAMPVALSGCMATVEGEHGRVVVDDGDRYDYDRGKFCPPGHAKKGWC